MAVSSLLDPVIDKCSTVERNKLSDHFNCILEVRIDSTTCDRNMKENYFGVQNRVERFKGDGLLICQVNN